MTTATLEARLAPTNAARRLTPRLHHIAIQTRDLENSKAWYGDFFGCHVSWSLSSFSPLTLSRLPGIVSLVEMAVGDIRFHLFERNGDCVPHSAANGIQFQHICIAVDSHSELASWRQRWLDLFASGRYVFALRDAPTEIVVDADGVESFYAFDVDGLEFEVTFVPSAGDELQGARSHA